SSTLSISLPYADLLASAWALQNLGSEVWALARRSCLARRLNFFRPRRTSYWLTENMTHSPWRCVVLVLTPFATPPARSSGAVGRMLLVIPSAHSIRASGGAHTARAS